MEKFSAHDFQYVHVGESEFVNVWIFNCSLMCGNEASNIPTYFFRYFFALLLVCKLFSF